MKQTALLEVLFPWKQLPLALVHSSAHLLITAKCHISQLSKGHFKCVTTRASYIEVPLLRPAAVDIPPQGIPGAATV